MLYNRGIMRNASTLLLLFFAGVLTFCAIRAFFSKQAIAKKLCYFLVALLFPLCGNIIVIVSRSSVLSSAGYYLYLVGTDLVFYTLFAFIMDYCSFSFSKTLLQKILLALTLIDIVLVFSNLIFGFVFSTQEIFLPDDSVYYAISSRFYHYVHLIFNYLFFTLMLSVLVIKLVITPKIYIERFIILLIFMLLTAAFESYYIFANIPIDLAMVGYAVCGLLIYILALYYRPIFLSHLLTLKILAISQDAYFFYDRNGKCIFANKSAKRIFGTGDQSLASCSDRVKEFIQDKHILARGNSLCGKVKVLVENQEMTFRYEYYCFYDKKERFVGSFLKATDISAEENEIKNRLFASTHDPLTGLYNKEFFIETVRKRIKTDKRKYFLMVSDIKDFKLINNIYGNADGNILLKQVANALSTYSDKTSIFCRLGNDKFAVFALQEKFSEEKFLALGRKVFKLERDLQYPVIVHLGVYFVEDTSMPISFMLDRAFMAISKIKSDYSVKLAYYDEKLHEEKIWEQTIAGQLSSAIENGEIVPFLQPQVDCNGKLKGAEVLVRWIHHEKGLLPPISFIPIFEKNGLISTIDVFMWEEACRILAKWNALGIKDISISVNISPKDFYFVDLYETFTRLVKKYGIKTSSLHLEITETLVMTDLENRLKTINALRNEGFVIEIDDFGSGYSSLNMLKDLPLDVIKIDMAFLNKSQEKEKARIILEEIINLAHKLSLPTITEGVELKEQLDMLVNFGGAIFQGFYFSKPIPLSDFEKKYFSL